MFKNIVLAVGLILFSSIGSAKELISIYSPYSASHSGTAAMREIIEVANSQQNKYTFILEFKPGGEQIIAVNSLNSKPKDSLAIIAPKYVEHVMSGKLNESDYIPIHALGDACWAVISNLGDSSKGVSSLANQRVVVGGVGLGNAAHLTSLEIKEKFNVEVEYVLFRSNFDALVLMVGDNSVNMVLDRVQSYKNFKDRNPNIKMLGMSCPTRHPDAPNVLTLKEQGIDAPFVFNIIVAHKEMPEFKRNELKQILDQATLAVGPEKIRHVSDMNPPIFSRITTENYYNSSISLVKRLLIKHKDNISTAK